MDLVCSALLQMLDLDVFPDLWRAPAEFAPLRQLPGLPHHGIGRSCKAGKEEIVGLLVALERFAGTDDTVRNHMWHRILAEIVANAGNVAGITLHIADGPVPTLEVAADDANALAAWLAAGTPSIQCSLARRHEGVLLFSPVSLTMDEARIIGERLRAH
jgi:L-seryl-tRNA(Ser) seleniumtransferase